MAGTSGKKRRRPKRVRKRRVLIVDDHPIVRNGLALLIDQEEDLETCAGASSVAEAVKVIEKLDPDLALVDISLEGASGIELVKAIHAGEYTTEVLVLSMHDESLYAERALRAGARGYVMKQETPETVLKAVRVVLKGGVYLSEKIKSRLVLDVVEGKADEEGVVKGVVKGGVDRLSDRELEVFQMLGAGHRVRDIAASLGLSTKTVETHRDHIKRKLGLNSSNDVLYHAIRWVETGGLTR